MPDTHRPTFPTALTPINHVFSVLKRDATVIYFVGPTPVFAHDEKDRRSFWMYVAQMAVTGRCKHADIAKAFGITPRNLKRYVSRLKRGGPGDFFKPRAPTTRSVLTPEVLRRAQEYFNDGKGRKDVARLVGLKRDTLYRALHEGLLIDSRKERALRRRNEADAADSERDSDSARHGK